MILITGGTGFLGSHLIYHLLTKVDKIRAIKRPESNLSVLSEVFAFYNADADEFNERIEWVDADLTDISSLDSCFDSVTKVYHAAGKVSFLPGDKDDLIRVNAEGTANMVNLAIEKKVSKLLYVSSIAAIGRGGNEKVIDEKVDWKSSAKNSMYAVSKYTAEREVWRGIAEGLNAVIVNPSIILGVGDFEKGSARMIRAVDNGLKFYTSGINGFVDVQDVVQVMIRLMESEISGERFIVSSENLDYKTVFEYIAEGLKKPPPMFAAGKFISGMVWRGAWLKSLLTGNRPFISKEIAQTANAKHYYSSNKLIKLIGYEFKPMKQTILEICRHHRRINSPEPVLQD
jgi:dihydroflavonol-4-reductase